jgi:phage shock protein A
MEANGNEAVGRLAQVIMDQQKEIDNLKQENKGLLALAGRFETELVQARKEIVNLEEENEKLDRCLLGEFG